MSNITCVNKSYFTHAALSLSDASLETVYLLVNNMTLHVIFTQHSRLMKFLQLKKGTNTCFGRGKLWNWMWYMRRLPDSNANFSFHIGHMTVKHD
jgi:hypothetical protein